MTNIIFEAQLRHCIFSWSRASVAAAAFSVLAYAMPVLGGTVYNNTRDGFHVTIPDGWYDNAADVATGDEPFEMCSSSCKVQMTPVGEAEVVIQVLAPFADEIATLERHSVGQSAITRKFGSMPPEIEYRWGDGHFWERDMALRRNGKLFLVHLIRVPKGQQSGAEYDSIVLAIVNSITVP